MSNAKHTSGPWVVNGFGGDYQVVCRLEPHGVAVSAMAARGDEIKTAKLIAAAPDLLEALTEAHILLRERFGHADAQYDGEALHVLTVIDAALAKVQP